MSETATQVDPERLKSYMQTVYGTLGGAMTSALISRESASTCSRPCRGRAR